MPVERIQNQHVVRVMDPRDGRWRLYCVPTTDDVDIIDWFFMVGRFLFDSHQNYWSDEDEDTPPDFNEDGKTLNNEPSKPLNQEGYSTENDERVLVPVLPDGRPRERW